MNIHARCRDCALEKCCLENEVQSGGGGGGGNDDGGSTEH